MLDHLRQDLRVALRALRSRPTFTAVALVTLALGIGANAVIFSVTSGLLLRPLPYGAPERLAALWPGRFISSAELLYLRDHARTLAAVATFSPGWSVALAGEGEAVQLAGARTSANFFGTLGVRPAIGRGFAADDEHPGAEPVAILSDALWRARFGADPAIVGRRIYLDGNPHTVVGVMPRGFEFHRPGTELWMPIGIDPGAWHYRGAIALAVGRLRPGATVAAADAELRALRAPMVNALGLRPDSTEHPAARPLRELLVGDVRAPLLVLFGAVAFIACIAVANVANLLLVRVAERRRELAVRVALGAGRGRLVRQFLVEGGTLAVAGGALGVAGAAAAAPVVRRLLPGDTPLVGSVGVDWRVLAACAAVVLGSTLLFATAPVFAAARSADPAALRARGDAGGRRGGWLRAGLATAQVALALVLVVGAGLMVRTLWNLSHIDPGFRAEGVVTVQLQPSAGDAARRHYFRDAAAAIRRVPGVVAVGAVHHLPLSGYSWGADVEADGEPLPSGGAPRAGWRIVDGDYFRAMGIPLLAGRTFDARDDTAAVPAVMISDRLAAALWPGRSALGRQLTAGNATLRRTATVVGVVGGVRHDALASDPGLELYRPASQQLAGAMTFVVRTAGDPMALAAPVRRAVRAVDPDVPIAALRALDDVVAASVVRPRLITRVLVAVAVVGLLLGAVGVYGVVAFAVGQRAREMAIRLALGAEPGAITRLVLRAGVGYAAAGIGVGLPGALILARGLRGQLFGVDAVDPATYAAVAMVIATAVIAACWRPARRAARAEPMAALRGD
jgi:predicted permease